MKNLQSLLLDYLLFEYGAKINQISSDRDTAFTAAIRQGQTAAALYLVEKGEMCVCESINEAEQRRKEEKVCTDWLEDFETLCEADFTLIKEVCNCTTSDLTSSN
jgi:ankyrin repeat protein